MVARIRPLIIVVAAFVGVAGRSPKQLHIDAWTAEYCDKPESCLSPACMSCTFPACALGANVNIKCKANANAASPCNKEQVLQAECLYCWQLPSDKHQCEQPTNCTVGTTELVTAKCWARPDIACKGNRIFLKNIPCNWSAGYSWARTLFLSVTLGGFGIDRFYLGLWKSGIGKLFSFGGLGIWTVVDVILVAIGYIRPHDGSAFV